MVSCHYKSFCIRWFWLIIDKMERDNHFVFININFIKKDVKYVPSKSSSEKYIVLCIVNYFLSLFLSSLLYE